MAEEFLTECLIVGFPGNFKNDKLINFCTLSPKVFIYIHKIKIKDNNNIEFLSYLSYIKIYPANSRITNLYLKKTTSLAGMCTFYFFTIWYNTDTDKTMPIRYNTKPLKNPLFFFWPFGILSIQYNSIQGP